MAYIGRTPTGSILTSADIADGSISTAKIQDNAVTAAKYVEAPSFRNLIINGDMSIAQRGTSITGITGNGYAIDRYRHQITNAGTWTISQSTDVPTGQGFAYSQKLDCTTADTSLGASDRFRFQQRIEGTMLQALKYGTSNAESITISFWVKSNKTGTYSLSGRDSGNSKIISASYTIDSANTWEKKTLTFAGTDSPSISNSNTAYLELSWWLDRGSTYSGGTYRSTWTAIANSDEAPGQTAFLADSTDNEWYITGVQLEVGTTASDFEFLPYDVNFKRCARYYQVFRNQGVMIGMCNGSTDVAQVTPQMPTLLRATPTIYCASGFIAKYGSSAAASSSTGASSLTFTEDKIGWYFTINGFSGLTDNAPAALRVEADMTIDAEL